MQIDRQHIIDLLLHRGHHDTAEQAQAELPEQVVIDEHVDKLARFGIDPMDLLPGMGQGPRIGL